MNNNLKLVINNTSHNNFDEKQFFEKKELKNNFRSYMLRWYLKVLGKTMVLIYQVNKWVLVFLKMLAESAMYKIKICKNFKPNNKSLKYLVTDSKR